MGTGEGIMKCDPDIYDTVSSDYEKHLKGGWGQSESNRIEAEAEHKGDIERDEGKRRVWDGHAIIRRDQRTM